MLTRVGDDELDLIKLPNGMTIKMDFTTKGDKDNGWWGWRGRTSGEYRRIRLYDKEDNLISELIEKNPLYMPPIPGEFSSNDSNVIY